MLRRALALLVLVTMCAASTGCRLVSIIATTDGSEGGSDDGASGTGYASDTDSDDTDDSDSDSDSDDGWDDEEDSDSDDGWDDEDED
jgi:hypothetical protein